MISRGICAAFLAAFAMGSADAGSVVMDASGSLQLKIPNVAASEGVVAVISSPGTSSWFQTTTASTDDAILALEDGGFLSCRGATLKGTSTAERQALSTSAVVADAIVVDGLTIADADSAGWRHSRHARTLTALFRARLQLSTSQRKQSLILCVKTDTDTLEDEAIESLRSEVESLYEAAAVEQEGSPSFDDLFDLEVVSVSSQAEADTAMAMAKSAAASLASASADTTLASSLQSTIERIRESKSLLSAALDPPHIAQAFVSVSTAYTKQARSARSKIASWQSRAARGLWIDTFGADAEALRRKILISGYDIETLDAAGLPLVAPYRLEMRTQLESIIDSAIRDLFETQISNLESSVLKKLRSQLLNKLDVSPEEAPAENASAMRAAAFAFDSVVEDLQVPSLNLSKDEACRKMDAKLTDEVQNFGDSPLAQLKRTKKVNKVAKKEKKPGQRSIDFGLDLVAMLRPDGFGNVQGYAGYNLGGSSLTFGIHNDADDPQVIAQFGGVRPPLLRFQPKLRVDVEM